MAELASFVPGSPAAAALQPGGAPARATPEAREVAEQFEAIFLAQILQTMTSSLGGENGAASGPLGGGDGPFEQMMTTEMAKLISKSGGIGVADAVLQEMLKAQEVA